MKFGVRDDEVENGYKILCDAYKTKIHLQLYPLITNVLIKERNIEIEKDDNDCYYTNAPNDIFKIFYDTFEMILSS